MSYRSESTGSRIRTSTDETSSDFAGNSEAQADRDSLITKYEAATREWFASDAGDTVTVKKRRLAMLQLCAQY